MCTNVHFVQLINFTKFKRTFSFFSKPQVQFTFFVRSWCKCIRYSAIKMVPNNTSSNRRRRLDHHFDDAVVLVCSAEVILRRGEAPRYLEAKINQLHKRLLKTTRNIEQGCCDEKTVVTVITPTICSSSPSSLDRDRGGLLTSINISHTSSISTISNTSVSQASSWTSNRSWPAAKRQAPEKLDSTPSCPAADPPGKKTSLRQQQRLAHLRVDDDWGHFVDATQMDQSAMATRPAPSLYRHFLRREIQSSTDARQYYQPP